MPIQVQVQFETKSFRKFLTTYPTALGEELGEANYQFAKMTSSGLRRELTSSSRSTQSRFRAGMRIKARKLSKNRSVVFMPKKLLYLDSMRPHYVALKRGRKIVNWVRSNFGNKYVSGRSNVKRGIRGGISGYLYVTPDPFIDKALLRVRNLLGNELRKGIKKAIKKSR